MNSSNSAKKYYASALCILAVIVALICAGFYRGWDTQKESFDVQTIKNAFRSTPNITLTLYYALWCGYSKAFLPEWEKFKVLAEKNLPFLKIVSINCEGGNEMICSQSGIEGYPTIVLQIDDAVKQYNGERTVEKLTEFVLSNAKQYL